MTICCAITDGKETWIASDTRICFGDGTFHDGTQKWHRVGPWWIAAAGFSRAHVVVSRAKPKATPGAMADEIKRLCQKDGWLSDARPGEPYGVDGSFLLAKAGQIWLIDRRFTPSPCPVNRLAAIGSGEFYAVGAACYIDLSDMAIAGDGISLCVEAATKNSYLCGGEPWVKRLRGRA